MKDQTAALYSIHAKDINTGALCQYHRSTLHHDMIMTGVMYVTYSHSGRKIKCYRLLVQSLLIYTCYDVGTQNLVSSVCQITVNL